MSTRSNFSIHQESLAQFLKGCDDDQNVDEQKYWQETIFSSVEEYQRVAQAKLCTSPSKISSFSYDSYINHDKAPSPYPKESAMSADGKLQSTPPSTKIESSRQNSLPMDSIFKVQFKHNFKNYIRIMGETFHIDIGSFVIVKCRNGEDIGIVVEILTMAEFMASRAVTGLSQDEEENEVGLILRIASSQERKRLPGKLKREVKIYKAALQLANEHHLQMQIVGAEYQFDSLKLTIHYMSDVHVDFRQFVKDLFLICRVRIWMKKTNACHPFTPYDFASIGLATGLTIENSAGF